jgi:hypothetical protein
MRYACARLMYVRCVRGPARLDASHVAPERKVRLVPNRKVRLVPYF